MFKKATLKFSFLLMMLAILAAPVSRLHAQSTTPTPVVTGNDPQPGDVTGTDPEPPGEGGSSGHGA